MFINDQFEDFPFGNVIRKEFWFPEFRYRGRYVIGVISQVQTWDGFKMFCGC